MTKMWVDTPPFRGAIVRGLGKEQTVQLLPERETYLEVFADLKPFKMCGLDFIRNGNGASALPSKYEPPPEPRKKK